VLRAGASIAASLLLVHLAVWTAQAGTVAPAHQDAVRNYAAHAACDTLGADYGFNGRTMGHANGTQAYQGISAYVDPDSGYARCTGPGTGDPVGLGASYLWVAVEDGAHNADSIIQIGLADCNDSGLNFWPACTGYNPGTHHYFYAYGGCNGSSPSPVDLGVADNGRHQFQVYLLSGNWHLRIDGSDKKILANTNSSISCWTGRSDTDWPFFGERHDIHDGMGTSTSPDTYWTTMEVYYGSPLGWHFINISSCSGLPQYGHCIASGSSMNIWTFIP
jgi:hypothetical protein